MTTENEELNALAHHLDARLRLGDPELLDDWRCYVGILIGSSDLAIAHWVTEKDPSDPLPRDHKFATRITACKQARVALNTESSRIGGVRWSRDGFQMCIECVALWRRAHRQQGKSIPAQ